jgi:hypothetical protein
MLCDFGAKFAAAFAKAKAAVTIFALSKQKPRTQKLLCELQQTLRPLLQSMGAKVLKTSTLSPAKAAEKATSGRL